MRAYIVEPDGTARDVDGRTIFFSFPRFQKKICKQGHCFVCGAAPNNSFNDEHIFPNWILKQCQLHNETLTLPNGVKVKYSTYKIPCCQACNSLLGKIYETPISEAICGGYDSLITYMKTGGYDLVCAWLALIFLKVHLRDFQNRVHLDPRLGSAVIGDNYELSELHHVHAFARAATAEIQIDEQVFGTLVILKIDSSDEQPTFDYCDNLEGRTILIQIRDIALIYILDDCGATANMLSEQLKTLPQPLSEIQLREVYARHVAANMHIKMTPTFRTEFAGVDGKPRITVDLPEFDAHEYQPEVFGAVFAGALGNLIESVMVDGEKGDAALSKIATGKVSFLFDENGKVRGTDAQHQNGS